jgi:hypothetical protein
MKIYKVEQVENPDVVQTFSVFDKYDEEEARHYIETAAGISINIQIVTQALAEALKSSTEQHLGADGIIPPVGDRTIVLCSVLESHRLYPRIAHPDIVYVSHDVRLQDKTIVMQLKDFSFLAIYSLTFSTPRKAELQIKFGLESDNIIVYSYDASKREVVTHPVVL